MRSVRQTILNAFEAMSSFGYVFKDGAEEQAAKACSNCVSRLDVGKYLSTNISTLATSIPDYRGDV